MIVPTAKAATCSFRFRTRSICWSASERGSLASAALGAGGDSGSTPSFLVSRSQNMGHLLRGMAWTVVGAQGVVAHRDRGRPKALQQSLGLFQVAFRRHLLDELSDHD